MTPKYDWYQTLPQHLKPDNTQVEKLEEMRKEYDLSDDLLMMGVANSDWALVKAQEETLYQFRLKMPKATERELWRGVIFSRFQVALGTVSPLDPCATQIHQLMASMDDIMKNISTWDEVIKYIYECNKALGFKQDGTDEIADRIEKILHAKK